MLGNFITEKLVLFQDVNLDPEVNGAQEGLEKTSIGDMSSPATIGSPVMEEVFLLKLN